MDATSILGKSMLLPPILLVAEAAAGGGGFPWDQLLTNGPPYIILAWYLWYDTCKVRPRREREHRDQMEMMQAQMDANSKSHKLEIREIVADYRADNLSTQTRYEAIITEQRIRHDQQMKENEDEKRANQNMFLVKLDHVIHSFKCSGNPA